MRSAGALVWRFQDSSRPLVAGEVISPSDVEVLLVHRPKYHDWSWPKGKAEAHEPIVQAAVREVEEEAGVPVRLWAPLTTQRYRLGMGVVKEVYYWLGTPLTCTNAVKSSTSDEVSAGLPVVDAAKPSSPTATPSRHLRLVDPVVKAQINPATVFGGKRPVTASVPAQEPAQVELTEQVVSGLPKASASDSNVNSEESVALRSRRVVATAPAQEIDEVKWVSIEEATSLLSRRGDRRLLQELQAKAENGTLVTSTLLLTRAADFDGEKHTYTRAGARQSLDLIDIYSSFGVETVCGSADEDVQVTLAPWVTIAGRPADTWDLDEAQRQQVADKILGSTTATAVCVGQRGAKDLVKALSKMAGATVHSALVEAGAQLQNADVIVAHLAATGDSGEVVAVEAHTARVK